MRFQVPQFLERETKIAGFLTFKQLGILGVIGIIFVILYYTVSTSVFVFALIVISGSAFVLIFIRIDGIPVYHLLFRSVGFFFAPKTYIWKKKQLISPIKLVEKKLKQEKRGGESALKISPESKLRKLSSRIETGLH